MMNLTVRLSTKLISLQNVISIELGQSSKSCDRSAIFIKGKDFEIELQRLGDDFNLMLFFILFWDETPTGQILNVKEFYKKTYPFLPIEDKDHFDSLMFK